MRKDEEKVKTAIIDFIYEEKGVKVNVIAEPNGSSTFPDYSIHGLLEIINLEVTNSGMGFCEKNGKIQERTNVDRAPFEKIFDEEYKKLGEWLLPNQALIITVKSFFPEHKQRKIIKKLLKMLKEQKKHIPIQNIERFQDPSIGDFSFLTNDDENPFVEIGVSLFENCLLGYSPIHILKGVGLASSNPSMQNNLTNQAIYILENILQKKENKSNDIIGKKWLAIINNHPLLTMKNYNDAIIKINNLKKISFARVFIIDKNKVFIIFPH